MTSFLVCIEREKEKKDKEKGKREKKKEEKREPRTKPMRLGISATHLSYIAQEPWVLRYKYTDGEMLACEYSRPSALGEVAVYVFTGSGGANEAKFLYPPPKKKSH